MFYTNFKMTMYNIIQISVQIKRECNIPIIGVSQIIKRWYRSHQQFYPSRRCLRKGSVVQNMQFKKRYDNPITDVPQIINESYEPLNTAHYLTFIFSCLMCILTIIYL
jgi:hypothetical protein